jgi:hypothetical protein
MVMRAGFGRGGQSGADSPNCEIHINLTRLLERQRRFERPASSDWLLEVHHHDVARIPQNRRSQT